MTSRKRHRLTAAAISTTLLLAACEPSEQLKEQKQYRSERTLAKVCKDKTKIWAWRGQLYVRDAWQYPDAKVTNSLQDVCQ